MKKRLGLTIGLLLLTGCTSKTFTVPATSMEPTIKKGSRVVVDRAHYNKSPVQRFDIVIVIVQDPHGKARKYMKRVVGLGGETVQITAGKVLIDGKELPEPYPTVAPRKDYGPVVVPDGDYFLLGDNRPQSRDSRHSWLGTISEARIYGKVTQILSN